MGWRFRKSFKVIPGVRLNISKSGISSTIGSGPFSLNVGPRGVYGNANIPGTGISFRHKLSGPELQRKSQETHPFYPAPSPQPSFKAPSAEKEEIKSSGTYELNSEGLEPLRKLLLMTIEERGVIEREILSASQDYQQKSEAYERWARGFLLKHIRKERFALMRQQSEEAKEKLNELQEQKRLTAVTTEIEVDEKVKPAFGHLCDTFSRLTESHIIWDTLSTQRTNQFAQRTSATELIERKAVTFRLGQTELMRCDWRVPFLENANGGDLFIYPGFVLYRVSRQSFALIDCSEVTMELEATRFIEEEKVPADSQVVGSTWKYVNKDGGPDRRFKGNYQIPIALYATLTIKSPTGLHERYLISNAAAAESFALSWQKLRAVFTKDNAPQKSQAGSPDEEIPKLLKDVIFIITDMGRASSSVLQRRLSIGYSEAEQIINILEQHGFIESAQGAMPRKVLQKAFEYRDQLEQM